MYGDKHLCRRYAKGVMYVSLNEFWTYVAHLEMMERAVLGEPKALIILTVFNALWFIDVPEYLEGDRALQTV